MTSSSVKDPIYKLTTTTDKRSKSKVVHPGRILEIWLKTFKISQRTLAKSIHITDAFISEIIHGKKVITENVGLRLSRYFGTKETFWVDLQTRYNILLAKEKFKTELKKIKRRA